MTLADAISNAAKELPQDWQICVVMDKGSVGTELWSPDGTRISPENFDSYTLIQQIAELLQMAKKCEDILETKRKAERRRP